MGKQRKIKQMRREMRAAEVKNPITIMNNTKEKHYVNLQQALEMFPDADRAELSAKYFKCLAMGLPGIPAWMPVQLATNHNRAIKKAYLRGGYNGVESYYDHVQQIINDNKAAAIAELNDQK